MQPVGELDDDDADVLSHRHEHLTQIFNLRVFFRLIGNTRQLRDAVDELRDFRTELRRDFVARDDRVFDDVVKDGGRDRRAVHLHVGEYARHGERMGDVLFARSPLLAVVRRVGEFVDVSQQRRVERRVVRLDFSDKIVDELRRHQLAYNAIDL